MPPVQYAEEIGEYKLYRRPVPRIGPMQLAPGQNPDGYGDKIQTDYVLQFVGEGTRRRVYMICHSNNGSLYVRHKNRRLFLRTTWMHSEIPDEPKPE